MQQAKKYLVVVAAALALRILMDEAGVDKDWREESIQTLFREVTSLKKIAAIDSKVLGSICIMNFENEAIVQTQVEKLT